MPAADCGLAEGREDEGMVVLCWWWWSDAIARCCLMSLEQQQQLCVELPLNVRFHGHAMDMHRHESLIRGGLQVESQILSPDKAVSWVTCADTWPTLLFPLLAFSLLLPWNGGS